MDRQVERLVNDVITKLRLTAEQVRNSRGAIGISGGNGGTLLAIALDYSDSDRLRVIAQANSNLSQQALLALNFGDTGKYDARTLLSMAAAGALLALVAEKLPAK